MHPFSFLIRHFFPIFGICCFFIRPIYVNYINSRDFSTDTAADDSPEGLKFVPASESPTKKALLMAACEVGGTVAVYELNR